MTQMKSLNILFFLSLENNLAFSLDFFSTENEASFDVILKHNLGSSFQQGIPFLKTDLRARVQI